MPEADAMLRRQRGHLHFDALLALVRQRFENLPEQRRQPHFSLADTLMAGLALFALKDPSLLAFTSLALDHNLRRVFGLQAIPSDTQMRAILDDVDPDRLRPVFQDVFRQLQRAKVLEDYVFLEGCYLLALDGVEYFRSPAIHCEHCLSCQHRNGEVAYYHQLLGAALIPPAFPEVIPLPPDPIQRPDAHSKNDCERNAARRWLLAFRKTHPHLPVIIVEDALAANAPHVRDLLDQHVHFILGVKEGDHEHLFGQYQRCLEENQVEGLHEEDVPGGGQRSWLFVNGLSLNDSNADVIVNLLVYVEVEADGTVHRWAWVTDLILRRDNVRQVARGGRTRWR